MNKAEKSALFIYLDFFNDFVQKLVYNDTGVNIYWGKIFLISGDVFKALIANAAIISSGIYLMGRFLPLGRRTKEYDLKKIIGVAIISSASLLFPLNYHSGGILLDLRQVPIATYGLVSGMKVALISSLVPGLFRLYLGGVGAWTGFWFMCILPAVAGGLIHIYEKRRSEDKQFLLDKSKHKYFLVLPLITWVLIYIPLKFILPGGEEVLKDIIPSYFIVLIGAYCLIGLLVIDCVKVEFYKRRLEYEASTDFTTTLTNHRYFMSKAHDAFNRVSYNSSSCSVILLDIDDFKVFNDIYGHIQGNRLLTELSELLLNSTRSWDIVARYGGEEFIIFMENTNVSIAKKVAQRMRGKVENTEFVPDEEGRSKKITVSLGVAGYPQHGSSLMDIIEKADIALYDAKNKGKNSVVLYDQSENNIP